MGDKLQNTSWIFGQKEIIYAKLFVMIQDKKQRILHCREGLAAEFMREAAVFTRSRLTPLNAFSAAHETQVPRQSEFTAITSVIRVVFSIP